jgi:hypothetical protein
VEASGRQMETGVKLRLASVTGPHQKIGPSSLGLKRVQAPLGGRRKMRRILASHGPKDGDPGSAIVHCI